MKTLSVAIIAYIASLPQHRLEIVFQHKFSWRCCGRYLNIKGAQRFGIAKHLDFYRFLHLVL